MVVIKLGKEWSLKKCYWEGHVSGYFESERHAEKYLVDCGYDKDTDGIFFKENINNEFSDVAVIDRFEKIDVSI